MLDQAKITAIEKDDALVALEMEKIHKSPEASYRMAFDHAKEEIKGQIDHWRKESLQAEREESDTICYDRAMLGIYTDLLAFLAEKY